MHAWIMFYPDGRILIDTRDFESEADVWRIVLGWPDGVEIERAKSDGYKVIRAHVSIDAEHQ